MKKIAIVVGLSLAGVANAAVVYNEDGMNIDLYGKTEARHQFEKGKDSDGKDDSYFRAGVKARTKLNEQFDAIGQYEGEYDFAKHKSE
ncbi:porin, partial [Herbiconiux daphne]